MREKTNLTYSPPALSSAPIPREEKHTFHPIPPSHHLPLNSSTHPLYTADQSRWSCRSYPQSVASISHPLIMGTVSGAEGTKDISKGIGSLGLVQSRRKVGIVTIGWWGFWGMMIGKSFGLFLLIIGVGMYQRWDSESESGDWPKGMFVKYSDWDCCWVRR